MKMRKRYLVILAAVWGPCLALGAAAYPLVLQPRLQYTRELQAQVAVTKERYERACAAARKENQARLAGEVEALRGRVSDFVVGLENASDLAFEISALAGQMQLDSFSMKPANAGALNALPASERVGEKHIDVSFSAGFPQFAAFVNALERHRPVLFVETFTISRPADASLGARSPDAPRRAGSGEPQVNMQLAVLVEKPPGE